MFKLKPKITKKPKVLKNCPRLRAGWICKARAGMPCPDCGRGVIQG